MPRVLLINPPCRHRVEYGEMGLYVPTALLNLSAVIRDICDLKIFDTMFTDCEDRIVRGHRVVGSSFDRIRAEIERYDPDIVGISASYSSNAGLARITGHLCKEVDPETVVVVGGPDASVRYSFFLESGCCDLCVIGEGERSFREIIERHGKGRSLAGISGTAWLENGKVRFLPGEFLRDLDDLPFPDYGSIDLPAYLEHPRTYKDRGVTQRNSISIFTSRGCPYSCNFCSIHLHMGKKYRTNSPGYVLEHMDLLIDRYRVAHFHFEDDNLTLDRQRFEQMLEGIASRKITWEASNGMRVDSVDGDLLGKMKASGFTGAYLPIESGSQRILTEVINKNLSLEKVEQVVREAHALGLNMSAFYVIGFPDETLDEMKTTLDLSIRLKQEYQVNPVLLYANPLQGTRLYDTCIEEGLIDASLGNSDYPPPTPAVLDEEPVYVPGGVSRKDLRSQISCYRSRLEETTLSRTARSVLVRCARRVIRIILLAWKGIFRAQTSGAVPHRGEDSLFNVRYGLPEEENSTRVGLGMNLSEYGFVLLTNDRLAGLHKLTVGFRRPGQGRPEFMQAKVKSIRKAEEYSSLYYFAAEILFAGPGCPPCR